MAAGESNSSDDLEQENSLSACLARLLAQEPEILQRRAQSFVSANESTTSVSSTGRLMMLHNLFSISF